MIFYAVTFRCVRTCSFCFNRAAAAVANQAFSWTAYAAILQEIAECRSVPGIPLRLNLTGGEPLLEPHISDLAAMAKDLGIPVSLTTAGYPIPPERVRRLADAGTEVTLSFDCCDLASYERIRGKGTYHLAIESLDALAEADCIKRSIIVVTRETIEWIEQTVSFLARFGIREFILMEQTLPPEEFARAGLRLSRSRILSCQRLEPRVRFILGHSCPATLNVSPNGQYFIQIPPESIQVIGPATEVSLRMAYDQFARVAASCVREPSEIFEPLAPASGNHIGR